MQTAPSTAQVTLFCLPFSGGTVYSYQKLKAHFAEGVKMRPLELPGHGKRMREALLTDIHAMTDDLFNQAHKRLSEPYAIYGHSLGALLAYLLTCKISRERARLPQHLIVSGNQAPSSIDGQYDDIYRLPREEFIQHLRTYGGLPESVAAHTELMDLFLPLMRADFQAIAAYRHVPTPKLDVPMTVMFGSDEGLSEADISAWQDVTTPNVAFQQFSGRHFFIFDHASEVARLISTAVLS